MRCWLSHGTRATTCVSLNNFQFLPLRSWHCAHQRWNLHLNWCCHSWFNDCTYTSPILHNLRICCFHYNSSQKKKLLQSTPHLSIPPFNNWSYWMFTQKVQCVFTRACQCYLELKMQKGLPLLILVTFHRQKISITLERMQTSSILNWVILIGLATFQLPPL